MGGGGNNAVNRMIGSGLQVMHNPNATGAIFACISIACHWIAEGTQLWALLRQTCSLARVSAAGPEGRLSPP